MEQEPQIDAAHAIYWEALVSCNATRPQEQHFEGEKEFLVRGPILVREIAAHLDAVCITDPFMRASVLRVVQMADVRYLSHMLQKVKP